MNLGNDNIRGYQLPDHRMYSQPEPDEGNEPYKMPAPPDYATVWEQLRREAKHNSRLAELIETVRAPD